MKFLLSLLMLLCSFKSFGGADWFSSKRVSTPYKLRRGVGDGARYYRLVSGLETMKRGGLVNCNTSYNTGAHAMICNCANEAGNQNMAGMTAVSRVVLSRLKSPDFPSTVKGVICQRNQFSWTRKAWTETCQKTVRSPRYFSVPQVKGKLLNRCVNTSKAAARIELVNQPKTLFALNYCSTNRRAYKNGIPRWCRTLIKTKKPIDEHVFGFAGGIHKRRNPIKRSSKARSVSFFDYIKNLNILSVKAYASTEAFEIINTKSKQRTVYGDKIAKILKGKYKNFSPYLTENYKTSAQELMKGVRDNLPSSAVGDYNGDGRKDLILMGSDKKRHMIIAFLSKGEKFQDYVVDLEPVYKKPLDTYLVNIQKSKIVFKNQKIKDAIQIETFGGAVETMLFDGEKFVINNSVTGFKFK